MSRELNRMIENALVVGVKDLTGYVDPKPDTVKLTIGEPNYNTDESIKAAAIDALLNNDTHYPPALGYESVRETIRNFEFKEHGLKYALDEILVTQGSTEAIACVLYSILNEGDEIIVPTPYYPVYRSLIEMNGGKVVAIETKDTDFVLDPTRLSQTITPKTKAVLITTPNNPTGTMYDKQQVEAIAEVLLKHDCFVIVDEIYARILYTDYCSLAQIEGLRDRVIVIQSFSKIYAMTGWRLGYICAEATLIEAFLKWHHNVITGVTSFIQHAIVPALELDVTPIVDDYKARRDYTVKRLLDMGFDVQSPKGAFYVFPSIAKFGMDSVTFCSRCALENRVMFVPGKPFGADDHIRISFCYDMSEIEEGLNRLEAFIATL